MKVVVTGATGNVGTSVLGALGVDDAVDEIIGVARRLPEVSLPKVTWMQADVSTSRLDPIFEGADAVVHLAWLIQPARSPHLLEQVNVTGSKRVFDAVERTGVPNLVYSSSVGAYSPGIDDDPVDETWPTGGIASSVYSSQKAAVERALDAFESTNPTTRVVRLRPSLIFKGEAASEIRRYFLGPLAPTQLLRWGKVPVLPLPKNFRLQAVHSSDVGEAYRLAVTSDVRGAFNIAAEPLLTRTKIAELLNGKAISIPEQVLRGAVDASWRLRLQRTSPGWFDMGMNAPVMSTSRARDVLGWKPEVTAEHAFLELVRGLAHLEGWASPPLRAAKF